MYFVYEFYFVFNHSVNNNCIEIFHLEVASLNMGANPVLENIVACYILKHRSEISKSLNPIQHSIVRALLNSL